VDLFDLVQGLRSRDLAPPILLRFPGITGHRMGMLRAAFARASEEAGFRGQYQCVYPIKVNQARHVCEEIRDLGAAYGIGLEAGTKPELLAVLALTEGHDSMRVVCNGFKDREYLETVVLAHKLGRAFVPVIERFQELRHLIELVEQYGSSPTIGIRARLTARGDGRWSDTGGDRGKFGLSVGELLQAVELLRDHGLLDKLGLLHCHIGSQISEIGAIKSAIAEMSHLYVELARLGAPLGVVDVGGGLGVDYDGSKTAGEASINYSLEEYASDIVSRTVAACDRAGIPHPDIVSESGRALSAYSSVLICDVLGSRRAQGGAGGPDPADLSAFDEVPLPVQELVDAHERLETADPSELYHDVVHARRQTDMLFRIGEISIELRATADRLFWAICTDLEERSANQGKEALNELPDLLSDLYYCNLSVFQSLPDHWAIDQPFPVMPIHRLDEKPDRRAVLMDITCDSDGRIDRFIDGLERPGTLAVHSLVSKDGAANPEPYYLGVFLVGAYQETLGDLHNLLGDTHAVHVDVTPDGRPQIRTVVEGDTVREVLGYVQFDVEDMRRSFRQSVESAIEAGRVDIEEATRLRRFFDSGLDGYTYLE